MDPLARYKQLVGTLRPDALATTPVLSVDPQQVVSLVAGSPDKANAEDLVADYISRHTPLTEVHARAMFSTAHAKHLAQATAAGRSDTKALTDANKAAAKDVTQAANEAASAAGVSATLSDPQMLGEWVRGTFATGAGAAIVTTLVLLFHLGRQQTAPSPWAFVGMYVALFFLIVAMLVLVMGYKNVQMSGSFDPSGATKAAGSPNTNGKAAGAGE